MLFKPLASHALLPLGVIVGLGGLVGSPCAQILAPTPASSSADSSMSAPADSLVPGVADSTATAEADEAPVSILDVPVDASSWLALGNLRQRRFETLDDLLRDTPGVSLRVDGDRGMMPYLSTNPLDPGWVEMDVDGVPTQNPGDDESALWDLPVAGLATAVPTSTWQLRTLGSSRIHLRTEDGLEGRTRMRTHFSSAANESYYRGVSLRTPKADRALRLDYGEWKTEEGTLFTVSPNLGGVPEAGRSKLRHFSLGSDLRTDVGLVTLRYGRGTRFFRGDVAGPQTVERWTGRLSLGLQHESERRRDVVVAYHLDWHVDDEMHNELRDAARRGVSWESRPLTGAGLFSRTEFETRGARFETIGDSTRSVRGVRYARWSPGWRVVPTPNTSMLVEVELLHAENARRDLDVGGWVDLAWRSGDRSRISVGARRRLRAPSLLETDGWSSRDTVAPIAGGYDPTVTTWRRLSQGSLDSEFQDLAYLRAESAWWGARWSLGVEQWRLRQGIGWDTAPGGEADFVGGLELDRTQLVGSLDWRRRWAEGEVHFTAWGHRVLGSLRHDASRGGGWPVYATHARAGISRRFFSTHNRIGLDVVSRVLGPRFDDRHVVLAASDQAIQEWNLEASLRVRDAVIRISYDNLLDAVLDEVLGSFRRGRQMRMSLQWDFFN